MSAEGTASSDRERSRPENASKDAGGSGASLGLGLGIAAGIGASLCCLPIVLLLLGAGGAWMGALVAMEPYRPLFIALTAVFLGLAFRKLYLVPRSCDASGKSAFSVSLKRQRRIFWLVTVVVAAFIAFPWYMPLFLD